MNICKEKGCNTKALARGLCANHYKIQRQNGTLAKVVHPEKTGTCPCGKKATGLSSRCKSCNADISEAKNKRNGLVCAAETCESSRLFGKGMCQKHYQQVRRHGKIIHGQSDSNPVEIIGEKAYLSCMDRKGLPTAIVVLDREDLPKVTGYKWAHDNSIGYARTLVQVEGKRKRYGIHHVIMGVEGQAKIVDHIDGDKLHCCKSNLRLATIKQNSRNSSTGVGTQFSVPGVKGVHYSKTKQRYVAKIEVDGKTISRYFQSLEAAIECRRLMALEHHREFAYENRPNESRASNKEVS